MYQSLLFNKVAGFATLIKKRLQHGCFPVYFVIILRTPSLQNISGRLLLNLMKQFTKVLNGYNCKIAYPIQKLECKEKFINLYIGVKFRMSLLKSAIFLEIEDKNTCFFRRNPQGFSSLFFFGIFLVDCTISRHQHFRR